MGSTDQRSSAPTPMDRLPLALKMNPGLDGLYAQTLERSEHLPHFLDIISTIALLEAPLPTSGIAELLQIKTYEVVNALVDLQAIIPVPGTDDIPVTLCHASLRDFLTDQSRSGRFYAHSRHHARLFLRCLECELELRRKVQGVHLFFRKPSPVIVYALDYSVIHLGGGRYFFEELEFHSAIQLLCKALELRRADPDLIYRLALVVGTRSMSTGSLKDREDSISLYRQALALWPPFDPYRWRPLNDLGSALIEWHRRTGSMADLEEAISLYRAALGLQPSRHPDALNNLGNALLERYRVTEDIADREEAIFLHREALELRPSPHPDRWISLHNLAYALMDCYRCTGAVAKLEEIACLLRETLECRHPQRSMILCKLVESLQDLYKETSALPYLEEAISHCEELIESHLPVGHQDRVRWASNLTYLLQMRFDATNQQEDLTRIEKLKEDVNQWSAPTSPNSSLLVKTETDYRGRSASRSNCTVGGWS